MGKIILVAEEYSMHFPNMNQPPLMQHKVFASNGSDTGFFVNVPTATANSQPYEVKVDPAAAYMAWHCKPGTERYIKDNIEKRTLNVRDETIYQKFFDKNKISDFIEASITGNVFFRRKSYGSWDFIFENIEQYEIFKTWFDEQVLPTAKLIFKNVIWKK